MTGMLNPAQNSKSFPTMPGMLDPAATMPGMLNRAAGGLEQSLVVSEFGSKAADEQLALGVFAFVTGVALTKSGMVLVSLPVSMI
eukprot:COSAG01_NODE_1389_length_10493_cov_12.367414_7_plen_85_part_00